MIKNIKAIFFDIDGTKLLPKAQATAGISFSCCSVFNL